MRSIWNGAISFGLVSIPIKLVNATENHSISFRQIHLADGGRIRYRKVCELDGEEIETAEIGKGYEEADGAIIPVTDEDLAQLPLPTAKTIEIVSFVPATEIDPLQMDAAYYLAANGVAAAKPYTLLREALKRSERVAIAKFALRGRERLGMLRVIDDVIAMHGLLWPDEIRAPEGVAPDTKVTVRDAELDLADALMATLGEVEVESLHDEYREAVEAMLAAKAGEAIERELPAEGAEAAPGQVIDLMAALEKSVRAARASRGEDAEAEGTEGAAGAARSAEVTPLTRKRSRAGGAESGASGRSGAGGSGASARKRAPAAPKAVGGKKSTSTAKSTTSTSSSSSASSAKAAGAAGAARTKKSTSKTSTAKSTKTTKTTKTAATAKKATPRKRTSA
ncbi:Ku protein [Streptomyces sp. NPDC048603]|uniref:non-homologous end joining protein Ku n=1 Tax=Streptomyces sp. NPDC048603 TaxID=3365577 RepID=UPI00372106D9